MSDKNLPTLTEAYQTGWDHGYGAAMAHALTAYPAPERAILLDLIAELRAIRKPHMGTAHAVIDRAEARLREVTGDE